jgi:hypothetical protein
MGSYLKSLFAINTFRLVRVDCTLQVNLEERLPGITSPHTSLNTASRVSHKWTP